MSGIGTRTGTGAQAASEAPTAAHIGGPRVSMLLLAYQQEASVGAAIAGALAQTWSPLEIVVSDDASTDATWAAIEQALAGYAGPHRIVRNRNQTNLGIGAHLNRLVALASGELLVVAAGDDISAPQRCERLVEAWLAHGRVPDLISSALLDLDAEGRTHGTITPTDLATYPDAAAWIARPPYIVGAAHAWSRRLFDRFGPLPAGTVAEDRLTVLRAVASGGAISLAEPLVGYRRGGLSGRRRSLRAADTIARLLKNNRHALVELPQMLADAQRAGQLAAVEDGLSRELEREVFVRDVFAASNARERWRAFRAARRVPLSGRIRLLAYSAWPGLFAPWFFIKRKLNRVR
jgi:glycosyltransferase involved in cell wall biosynthesis